MGSSLEVTIEFSNYLPKSLEMLLGEFNGFFKELISTYFHELTYYSVGVSTNTRTGLAVLPYKIKRHLKKAL